MFVNRVKMQIVDSNSVFLHELERILRITRITSQIICLKKFV
jgi:hypothetical protein